MRTVLVAGGAGAIGEGIVRALLGSGCHVIVPSREGQRLRALQDAIGETPQLTLLEGNVTDPDDGGDIREQILERFTHLDGLVVSVGGWWQGADLVDVPIETFESVVHRVLMSHFLIAKTFLPCLSASGRNPAATFIGGSASEEPVPEAGPTCAAGAAQIMLVRCLAAEMVGKPVRVNELVLGPVATRKTPEPDPTWITADDVGKVCAGLAAEGSTVRGQVIRLYDRSALGSSSP